MAIYTSGVATYDSDDMLCMVYPNQKNYNQIYKKILNY
jgi:hypothetical protein